MILNHLIFDKLQVIPGYVCGAVKVAFGIMREILYAPWSLVFLRRVRNMGRIPISCLTDTLWKGLWICMAKWVSWSHSSVEAVQGSYLVSISRGDCENLVSYEPPNEEWRMTNSCWNFFTVFINLCIDIILIKIILTAPMKNLWGL